MSDARPDRRSQVLIGAPARGLRGDGRGADPLRPLGQHQGAPRLLDRALRRRAASWSCRPSTSRSTSARCPTRSPRCSTRSTRPGDAWILNDPYRGGTHLPDITLISPVFAGGELLGFAASRAHHADVGGPTPGGMPADSRDARGGGRRDPADARATTRTLARARRRRCATPSSGSPTCAPSAAANRIGARRLRRAGRAPRRASRCAPAMAEILDYAERRTRAALAELPDGDLRGRGRARGRRRRRPRDIALRVEATIDGRRA